jgi:microcystin-dependent protein
VDVTLNDASFVVVGQMIAVQGAGGNATTAASLKCTAKNGNIVTLQNVASPPFPPADTTQAGLLNKLSGLSTDYVGGDNACHALAAVPTGAVLDFAGSTAPTGFLLCDGSAVSRSTQAALFAVIGTTYGAGDGSTTFNLPDLRSRLSVGVGTGGGLTARTLGDIGGEETHKLALAELAAHNHTDTGHVHYCAGVDHTHTIAAGQFSHSHSAYYLANVQGGGTAGQPAPAPSSGSHPTSTDTLPGGGTAAADRSLAFNSNSAAAVISTVGSGTGHNTMPPFLALNKIIKN